MQHSELTAVPPDSPDKRMDMRLLVPEDDHDGTGRGGFLRESEAQWHSVACPRQQSGESKHAAALGVGADLRGRRSAARAADAGPALDSPIDSSFFWLWPNSG